MVGSNSSVLHNNLSITPLGAGDLIDRAVRFYRQNFRTLLLIAAPPVIIGAAIMVGWRLFVREVFGGSAAAGGGDGVFLYYALTWLGNGVIWYFETVAALVVMGGASRNFVRHLLFGEALTFGETYRNVRSRLVGLTLTSMLITLLLGVVGLLVFYLGLIVASVGIMLIAAVFASLPAVAVILSIGVGAAATFGAGALFFLAASRFAYVPQVMTVEGLGAGASIGRSASLAGRNVIRLAALFVFTTVATYSALAILYVPIAWYAWVQGVEILYGNADSIPAWYEIASQLIGQASVIMMTPVWMIGLCLLYVDERVRSEGYDIELMAARHLGDIPAVPTAYVNPLQPALAAAGGSKGGGTPSTPAANSDNGRLTTLGLN